LVNINNKQQDMMIEVEAVMIALFLVLLFLSLCLWCRPRGGSQNDPSLLQLEG
jgi:hypothetical protein